jgi:superfamily II DNA or RNA helicase
VDRTERDQVSRLAADLAAWSRKAAALDRWQHDVRASAEAGERLLAQRGVVVARAGQDAWRVVPLERSHLAVVRHLRERALLPRLTRGDQSLVRLLTGEVPRAVAAVNAVLGVRRFFAGSARRQSATVAAQYLRRQRTALTAHRLGRLDTLGAFTAPVEERVGFDALLDPALGVDLLPENPAHGPELVDRSAVDGLAKALAAIEKVVRGEAAYRAAAREAADAVRQAQTQRVLREMPTDALRSATRDRLRLGALSPAGIHTVQQVLDSGRSLPMLPGLGEASARHILGAARTLGQTTFDGMPVRLDVTERRPEATELLRRLADWDASRRTRGAAADLERAAELAPLSARLTPATTHLLVIPVRDLPVGELLDSVDTVRRRAALLRRSRATGPAHRGPDPWDDFLARPADYFAMLAELGFLTGDEDATHGDLPEDIVKAVRDQALSGEHLTASLRGYQSFAARFALVQRKVIIGDEMGLGKTVEAIAVLAHLRSRGENRFLVVCPAAVVTNWQREVTGKSTLNAYRVHGPDRDHAARAWERDGGVAVTTYETLASWQPGPDLACVVVDEAHYIKNPQAQRTVRTAALVGRAARAILLTGTPLENRVAEFRNLASYVRPDLTVDGADLSPQTFRRQIAPAYLRRNQEDVLSELPGLVEVEEWLPLSTEDAAAYREAVHSGNFMRMRQAAMRHPEKSAKLRRLVEIVREAEENQRRVIVFSYFRAVLDLVAQTLPGQVHGPLTGAVPADERQRMVDSFAAARHGAVLVAQIVAGGVGLNIQAASVVVICEPQLKPTTEAQAIARAHRMGQVRSVQVHRLLCEDSVDQRIVELLDTKRRLFEQFARGSDIADAAPDAVDLSEAQLAREVVAAERERLLGR